MNHLPEFLVYLLLTFCCLLFLVLFCQVADEHGLEVRIGMPDAGQLAAPARESEGSKEDELSRRLAELKSRS